jgi:DNA-binding response OmpR family regulator
MVAKQRIFIVDDDVTALDLIDILFERKGFEVIRDTKGKNALDRINEINPDILLIDIMMPEMNGIECIKCLRENGSLIPIIAFTALHDKLIHNEAISAGANTVLCKPCKSDKLFEEVNRLL